jgi:ubiquinone/menaquinone biosynthesis C-methylase UbiE
MLRSICADSCATTFPEWLLLKLSRDPSAPDHIAGTLRTDPNNALDFLRKTVPEFARLIEGKRVLDFGCGWGNQAVAMIEQCHARSVIAVDIVPENVARTQKLAADHGLSNLIYACEELPAVYRGECDIVVSCSSFEHFSDPAAILSRMRDATKPGGVVVISWAEPWLSPYGAHMSHFANVPWVNILFSERTVMAVRSRFSPDGATRYEDVEGGLNRMTLRKFERIISKCGMDVECVQYYPVKGLPLVHRIPLVREFLTSAVAVVLRKR